jgi:hypothetical protein
MCWPQPGRLFGPRLLPVDGRTAESEDELRHRLAEDGAQIDKKYFNAALAVSEENGHAGGYDAGRLPGLPYRIVRPESRLPKTWRNPRPQRPVVLEDLRPN